MTQTSAVNASEILAVLGSPATSPLVESLLDALGTYQRPSLEGEDEGRYHDWVLIKRHGLELGFSDEHYHQAGGRVGWGKGDLLLTQAYFYADPPQGHPYKGELPFGLRFGEKQAQVRARLVEFEGSRHSHLADTWDVGAYRLTAAYTGQLFTRLVCRLMPRPIPPAYEGALPSVDELLGAFGESVRDPRFLKIWKGAIAQSVLRFEVGETQVDLTETLGVTLGITPDQQALYRSITFHRNRDQESPGWHGPLPRHLSFEDSPEKLFSKLGEADVAGEDSMLTGYRVWHKQEMSLHVLYSNVDNRLIRVTAMSPGVWKSVRSLE